MNTVKITEETKPFPKLQLGDILTTGASYYILNSNIITIDGVSKVLYSATNLETGAPWKRLTKNLSDAVAGLYFVGHNAEITIKFNSDK